MSKISFIFNLVFRPDRLEPSTYNKDPRFLSDRELITEACNILDESEEEVLGYVADRAHCRFDYDAWYKTGELPPMMKQWIRENIHFLRKRLTKD